MIGCDPMLNNSPDERRCVKVLVFTSLYPNAAMPNFGIFVENRLRHLVAAGEVDAHVVAPIPWFPSRYPRFGTYTRWARVPYTEVRHGLTISHPRYFLPPKIGMLAHPFLMAAGAFSTLYRMRSCFDVIDAHYYYPDGVAAIVLGAFFGRPVVITARGTDLNVYPRQFPLVRRLMTWAARRAFASVAVSSALGRALAAIDAPEERVFMLRNGVDLDLFRSIDHGSAQRILGISGPTILSVGNLIPLKGHDIVIRAMELLPEYTL